MKRTCKNCFAAETDMHPLHGEPHGCKLGHKTDGKGHPLEECQKPKSWKALERARRGAKKT